MGAQSDRLTDEQVMEALGSMGIDIETITRLTHYLTAPGMEGYPDNAPAQVRKVRSILIDRLFKTADALKTANAEGKI